MKSYIGLRIAGLALLGLTAAGSAQAATISLNQSAAAIPVGGNVIIDIMLAVLPGEVVGAIELDLAFNNAVVQATGIPVNDPDGVMGLAACETATPGLCEFSFGFTPGNYDLAYTADPAISEGALAVAQTLPFRVATLMLQGVSPFINSPLQILNVVLSDYDGLPETDPNGGEIPDSQYVAATVVNGSITVFDNGTPAPIPEPGTIALFGAGAAVLALRRFRRARS
jgi:hypothetical protein